MRKEWKPGQGSRVPVRLIKQGSVLYQEEQGREGEKQSAGEGRTETNDSKREGGKVVLGWNWMGGIC